MNKCQVDVSQKGKGSQKPTLNLCNIGKTMLQFTEGHIIGITIQNTAGCIKAWTGDKKHVLK